MGIAGSSECSGDTDLEDDQHEISARGAPHEAGITYEDVLAGEDERRGLHEVLLLDLRCGDGTADLDLGDRGSSSVSHCGCLKWVEKCE